MVLHGVTMDEKNYIEILRRIEHLEKAVFAKSVKPDVEKNDSVQHKGATGGIRLLVKEGFFDHKHFFGEVCDAAAARGYHYSKQAFQEALTRLSTKEKILVAIEEKGKKVYAIRR